MHESDPLLVKRKPIIEKGEEESIYGALNHSVRRQIIKYVYENVEVSYTDILRFLGVDTGYLNFHLRKLRELLLKTENDTYILTSQGKLAYEIIRLAEKTGNTPYSQAYPPKLNVSRRTVAFLLDVLIFFFALGLFLDVKTYTLTAYAINSFWHLVTLDVSYFVEHSMEIATQAVSHYSHVFLVVFIVWAALEAYKGQTLGKYLLKIRVVKTSGMKMSLMESVIRNLGKVFLLPIDIALGLLHYRKKGFLRFFDYYTQTIVETTE